MPESARPPIPESSLPPDAAARLAEARRQLAAVGGSALLIGVETYPGLPPDKQLLAGRNDVLSYWRVCRRLGYRARQIRILTSPVLTRDEILHAEVDLALGCDPHRTRAEVEADVARQLADAPWEEMLGEATQQAIRAGIEWLAQRLVPTVKLEGEGWSFAKELTGLPGLLAYSGHGAQLAGDLALCPSDVGADLSRALPFGELRTLIDASDGIQAEGTPRPADNLTVVLDCCFAAGASEHASLRVASLTPVGTTSPAVAKREIGNRVFCASARHEHSSQAVLGGRWHGAFSWAFTRALEQWQMAPSGQFQESTISHVELLFRTRMLLEALSFRQHPVLMDRIGNLPVFHPNSDVAEETSPEPDGVRVEGQIDPSTGFAAYEISDSNGKLLAQVVATKKQDPYGSGMQAEREYWKINGPSFDSSGLGDLQVKKISEGYWLLPHMHRPPFDAEEASFWCPVDKNWQVNSATCSYHKQEQHTGTWGGLKVSVWLDAYGIWRGSMMFYRESEHSLLFANLPVGSSRILKEGVHSPLQECSIGPSDIHSALQSGCTYRLYDTVRNRFIWQADGILATTDQDRSVGHTLTRKAGKGPIKSGDEIYIQSTQPEIQGHYLRSGDMNDMFALRYELESNLGDVPTWIIKKKEEHHVPGSVIRTGEPITLENEARQQYMEANANGDHLRLTYEKRLWNVSL